jgi:hypothetical protein
MMKQSEGVIFSMQLNKIILARDIKTNFIIIAGSRIEYHTVANRRFPGWVASERDPCLEIGQPGAGWGAQELTQDGASHTSWVIIIMIIIQGLICTVSPVMRIQSAVKCLCYLTQKQHTPVLQPASAKTTQTQHRNTRHSYFNPSQFWRESVVKLAWLHEIDYKSKAKLSFRIPNIGTSWVLYQKITLFKVDVWQHCVLFSVIDRVLFPEEDAESDVSGMSSTERHKYYQEIERIRSELAGFQPIDHPRPLPPHNTDPGSPEMAQFRDLQV